MTPIRRTMLAVIAAGVLTASSSSGLLARTPLPPAAVPESSAAVVQLAERMNGHETKAKNLVDKRTRMRQVLLLLVLASQPAR